MCNYKKRTSSLRVPKVGAGGETEKDKQICTTTNTLHYCWPEQLESARFRPTHSTCTCLRIIIPRPKSWRSRRLSLRAPTLICGGFRLITGHRCQVQYNPVACRTGTLSPFTGEGVFLYAGHDSGLMGLKSPADRESGTTSQWQLRSKNPWDRKPEARLQTS